MHQNLYTAFCEAFSLESQFCIHIAQQNGFPMFVLRPGLWVKKRDCLSLFERQLLQWNTLIKMKIPTVTIFWQFKACVMCEIFLKSLYIFKVSQGRKWNFNSERFWSRVIHANRGKWKKWFIIDIRKQNRPWQKKPSDSG